MNSKEIERINRGAKGSTLTRIGREAALHKMANDLRCRLNVQIKSFEHIKIAHIEKLVSTWKQDGLSLRTCQNNMAFLRTALREVGREKFAADTRISNKSLGIANASRDGTHRAPQRADALHRISAMPQGHKEVAMLQLEMGLRAREAIQSYESLKSWEKQLATNGVVTVTTGTKGGRTRNVNLAHPEARERAQKAVRAALEASKGGRSPLVPSQSLQGAARSYQREMAKAGFCGEQASHALRCAFARDQYQRHLTTAADEKEALRMLSLDLGHGHGRTDYCKQVYLKNSDMG